MSIFFAIQFVLLFQRAYFANEATYIESESKFIVFIVKSFNYYWKFIVKVKFIKTLNDIKIKFNSFLKIN